MKRGGQKSERHRSEVKNSRFNSHIKSTYCDELRNCQLHPVDPLTDPKSSSHGSVDVGFDKFQLHSEPFLLDQEVLIRSIDHSLEHCATSTPLRATSLLF